MELHLVSLSPCPDNTLCQKQTTAAVGLWLPWLTYCYVYWPLCVDVGGERLGVWGSSCTNPFSAVTWSIVRSRTGGIDYSGTVLRQKDAHPFLLSSFSLAHGLVCLSKIMTICFKVWWKLQMYVTDVRLGLIHSAKANIEEPVQLKMRLLVIIFTGVRVTGGPQIKNIGTTATVVAGELRAI